MLFYIDPDDYYSDINVTLEAAYDGNHDRINELIRRMITFAAGMGLDGNIWQQWLTYIIISHENPLSLALERRDSDQDSTLMLLALEDFCELRNLFLNIPEADEREVLSLMADYRSPERIIQPSRAGRIISDLSFRLAGSDTLEDFCRIIIEHYKNYGAGIYGLYRAFRVETLYEETVITPVTDETDVRLDDLIGYEDQKKALRENTEAFIKGIAANNALLYGDSGTGKSTSIHALMHDYYADGLRLVEIGKQTRHLLPAVLSILKKRNYRFIIFLDDLSFEENESDYKELKAMLEGALETGSDRTVIYATSNRRHLIRETWRDRNDMEYQEDIHHSDTMEEKLSLASRFGVTIYYSRPVPAEYLNIVRELAAREGIDMDDKSLEDAARRWELRHGGMSGRTASQFITWLKGSFTQVN